MDREDLVEVSPHEFLIELHKHMQPELSRFMARLVKVVDGAPDRFDDMPYMFKQSAGMAYFGACLLVSAIGASCHHIHHNGTATDKRDAKLHAAQVISEVFQHYAGIRAGNESSIAHDLAVTVRFKDRA